MEISNSYCVGGSSDQFFLAAGTRRQLGAWPVLSRAAHVAGIVVSVPVSDFGAAAGVLANAPGIAAVGTAQLKRNIILSEVSPSACERAGVVEGSLHPTCAWALEGDAHVCGELLEEQQSLRSG